MCLYTLMGGQSCPVSVYCDIYGMMSSPVYYFVSNIYIQYFKYIDHTKMFT